MTKNKQSQREEDLNLKSLKKKRADKIFKFIFLFWFWVWSISFLVGGSLLIGDEEHIKLGANTFLFGFIFNLGILIYCYWRKK